MSKVCAKCGREYGNASVRCAICKIPLEERNFDNSEEARAERLRQMQKNQTQLQPRQTSPQNLQKMQKIQPGTQPVMKSISPSASVQDGPSGLSIAALIFSLLGCISIVGLILGIVDLCTNQQRKKVCSILALVFSGVWLLAMVAFIGSSNSNRPDANYPARTPSQNNAASAGSSTGKDSVFGSDSGKTAYGLMETAQVNDVKVTMTRYEESAGSEWNHPSSGNVFLMVEFEIENNSKSDLNISSLLSFNAYADNYSVNFSLNALLDKSSETQLDGTIASGKKMRGWIGWEVPADWSEMEIHFTEDVWFGSTFKFIIKK